MFQCRDRLQAKCDATAKVPWTEWRDERNQSQNKYLSRRISRKTVSKAADESKSTKILLHMYHEQNDVISVIRAKNKWCCWPFHYTISDLSYSPQFLYQSELLMWWGLQCLSVIAKGDFHFLISMWAFCKGIILVKHFPLLLKTAIAWK